MIGIPEYLKQYVSDYNQKDICLSFMMKCTCGCKVFSIIKNSYTAEENRLKKEYEERTPDTGRKSIYGGIDANGKPYSYIKSFFFFKRYIEFPPRPVFMEVNVIKAVCSQCNKEITIFDSRYNGYDSQFTTQEQRAYVPHFDNSKAKEGNIIVNIEQYDEDDVAPEYFSWIQIFVTKGDKKQKFFDLETG